MFNLISRKYRSLILYSGLPPILSVQARREFDATVRLISLAYLLRLSAGRLLKVGYARFFLCLIHRAVLL